jgi:hypothetical protein
MTQPNPGATLASVLHLRLADFSGKSVVEQARLRAQLEAVVAASICLVPERERFVLDAPDGLALAVFGNPAGAFAIAQRCLEAAQVLPLCVGAHHGAIALGTDGDTGHALVGDGLRSAGVAAGFAKPSQIMATRAFREALAAHAPGCETGLVPAGTFADDSVRSHELFVASSAARQKRRRRVLIGGLACVMLGLLAGGGLRLHAAGVLDFPEAAPGPVQAAAKVPAAAQPAAAAATKPQPKKPAGPPPALLVFDVTPAGRVLIDGRVRGDIPALKRLELPPGRYQLEIRYRRETPLRRTLELRSGQQLIVRHKFFEPPDVLKKFDKLFKQ